MESLQEIIVEMTPPKNEISERADLNEGRILCRGLIDPENFQYISHLLHRFK